jgi:hypothetical protein
LQIGPAVHFGVPIKTRARKAAKPPPAPAGKRPRGRPRDDGYEPRLVPIAAVLTLLGYSHRELIDHFGTCKRSFYNWLARYPEFAEAVRKNGAIADAEVAAALRTRALGMTVREEKAFVDHRTGRIRKTTVTKEIPPSEVAAMMWLSNRQPAYWKHRNTMDLTNSDGSFDGFVKAMRGAGKTLEGRYRVVEPAPAPIDPEPLARSTAISEAAAAPDGDAQTPREDVPTATILQLRRSGGRLLTAPSSAVSGPGDDREAGLSTVPDGLPG